MSDVADAPAPLPRSGAELFFAFNRLALQGFGGVLAVAQVELVERRRWLTREDFVELLAISQVLPGPNIVNLALVFGDRCMGVRGAVAALGGLIVVPLLIVMALTLLYARFATLAPVAGALRGMAAVAAGLVIATALKLVGTLKRNVLGPVVCTLVVLATLIALAWHRLPLAWVLLGVGTVSGAIAYAKLKP